MRKLPYSPRAKLTRLQNNKLHTLMRNHLSPFYLERITSPRSVSLDTLHKVPVTDPFDFRSVSPQMRSKRNIADQNLISLSTSGSSGVPLTVNVSLREFRIVQLQQLRFFQIHGWKPWWKTVIIWSEDKSEADSPLQKIINSQKKLINVTAPLDEQSRLIQKHRPDLLFCPTDMLHTLALWARNNGIVYPPVRLIATCGSPLLPNMKALIQEVFRGKCVDIYGPIECGWLGQHCPHCGLYYFNEDSFILEVVNDHDQPASQGNILITTLERHVTPIIRYRIGDRITMAPDNHECPVKFRHFKSIDGRSSDVLMLPGGKTFSYMHALQLNSISGLKQFQFVQISLQSFVFRYTKETGINDNHLRQAVQARLPDEMLPGLVFKEEPLINPEKSGKYKLIVNQSKGITP
ncbi:hypothetical protein [Desulfonatronovibrio magnus]|uniref:hypothetical protein n=1 Tax=Desulfonatronovibrio magnus TaxID=698827 RepID=UPI0005EBBC65|nr:hypothetical protein [Desulfonatronovibrio magnus]